VDKVCSICLISQDLSAFYPRTDSKDGHQTHCKECNKARSRAYNAAHRHEISAKNRARYQAHHQERLARAKQYYETHQAVVQSYTTRNKEKIAARSRAYKQKHAARLREQDRAYRAAHREERRIKQQVYNALHVVARRASALRRRNANRERALAQLRAWKKANPDKARQHWVLRRARKRGATVGVPIKHVDIARRDNWMCHICHTKVARKDWSLDHLIPLSKGGLHIPENVALAHQVCNARRFVGNTIPAQLRLLPYSPRYAWFTAPAMPRCTDPREA
jgi:5-methylcytosine-specific restriction endonuclease McrA